MLTNADIAIIGGGPVSVTFLYQLEEKLAPQAKLNIIIFEPSENGAQGYAYRGDNEALLLNTPLEKMGVSPSYSHEFLDWLQHRYARPVAGEQFVPRYLFGRYLQEKMDQVVARKNKLHIQIIQEEAIDCILGDEQHQVTSKNHRVKANVVLLSHGGIILPAHSELSERPGYITDIYSTQFDTASIKEDAAVLVLGSGLSMIDACLLLRQSGKRLKITATSRSAYFPAIKPYQLKEREGELLVQAAKEYLSTHKNVQIKDLIWFFDTHFSRLLGRAYSLEEKFALYEQALVRSPLVEQDEDANFLAYFYPYIDSCVDEFWSRFSEDQKQRLSGICRYLIRFICGFPETNFNKLQNYFNGQGFVIEKLRALSFKDGHYLAEFQSQPGQIKQYDYVIDCTGMKGYYHPKNHCHLALNIRARKQIKIDQEGDLVVNQDGQVYGPACRSTYSTVYALGEGSSGPSFIRGCFSFYIKQAAMAVAALNRSNKNVKTTV